MAKVTFTSEYLKSMGLPYEFWGEYKVDAHLNYENQWVDDHWIPVEGKIISDTITGHTRWSVHHEIIFELEGKTYKTNYSVAATESQDERPWQYQDTVDCVEVHQVEKLVTVWEPLE